MKKITVNPLKTDLVIETIRNSIQEKKLRPGDRLPSLNGLSKSLSVSPSVVYRGLLALVDEGMLECQGTRGFFVPVREEKTTNESSRTAISSAARDRVYFSVGHHSDLTWHWQFEVYEKIRETQLNAISERLKKYPDLTVYVEQAYSMECYFEVHPEKQAVFQQAHKEGRFSLLGGFMIPDLNMVSGELLVRNLQLGRELFRKMFGSEPQIACEADAFGMCAQLPQILIKSGYKYLSPGRMPGLSLPRNQAFVWKGADGSKIPVLVWNYNIVPNCFSCNWPILYSDTETLEITMEKVVQSELTGPLLVHSETEVDPIPEGLFALIDRSNRKTDGRRIEFGSIEEYASAISRMKLSEFSGELNPVFTGCYTTRCGIKQKFRKTENRFFGLEMLGCLLQEEIDLAKAFRLLMECSFHDAICGCHTDIVNDQLNRKYEEINTILDAEYAKALSQLKGTGVFNPGPSGRQILQIPSKKDLSFEHIPTQRDGDLIYAAADFTEHGITPLKKTASACFKAKKSPAKFKTKFFEVDFTSISPEIRMRATGQSVALPEQQFGEILIRSDAGTMWTERFKSGCYGKQHSEERVISVESGPVMKKVITEGDFIKKERNGMGGFRSLHFRKEYRFFEETDYFLLKVFLDFQGYNTKVLIRFPIPEMDVSEAEGVYATPFGSQLRAPYFEVEKKYESTLKLLQNCDYVHASGDYPALYWVDYSDLEKGLSIANKGTVGHQCVNGWIAVSLLRSGTMVDDGCMTPEKGALDNGQHTFEFAIRPHGGNDLEGAIRLGEFMNHPPVYFEQDGTCRNAKSLFSLDKGNISVSGIRWKEGAMILRLYETLGKKTKTILSSHAKSLSVSDLQEKEWEVLFSETLNFSPYEIKTIKMEF